MEISKKLLAEMATWPTKPVPKVLFHGCRDGDLGLDLKSGIISGEKWFSIDPFYAGEYAWHWSRPDVGRTLRLELEVVHEHLAIERPDRLDGANWAHFLAECFPDVPPGYGLSYHFQRTLKSHIDALAVDGLHSYISNGGIEVCIPEVENFVAIRRQVILPKTKDEYREQNGLL